MIGLAGTGDLVATALAPMSRNRRAGELLAAGVPAAEIPGRIGQTVESLESVPLLARALEAGGAEAPVTAALARLIAGDLPLPDWVALVRATVPLPPAGPDAAGPCGSAGPDGGDGQRADARVAHSSPLSAWWAWTGRSCTP